MADITITTPEGRDVGISTYGDPMSDRLVVLCHPTPGAPFDPEPVVTSRWGVHMVGFERPGYGSSPALATGRVSTVRDRASDVDAFLKRIERNANAISHSRYYHYGVVGWGTGGVVAAAIAAHDTDRVDRLALIGTPTPAKAERLAKEIRHYPVDEAALGIEDGDADLDRHLGLWNRVQRMVTEAAVQGDAGVHHDVGLFADRDWTKRIGEVRAETAIWLGDRDPMADADDVRWWRSHLPNAKAYRVRDSGVLTIASAWSSVLQHVAPGHGSIEEEARDSGSVRVAEVDWVQPDHG